MGWGKRGAPDLREDTRVLRMEPSTLPAYGAGARQRQREGGARGRRAQVLAVAAARHREALPLLPECTVSPLAGGTAFQVPSPWTGLRERSCAGLRVAAVGSLDSETPRNSESSTRFGAARTSCPPRRRGCCVWRHWTRNVLTSRGDGFELGRGGCPGRAHPPAAAANSGAVGRRPGSPRGAREPEAFPVWGGELRYRSRSATSLPGRTEAARILPAG